jgi:hypothetical protein
MTEEKQDEKHISRAKDYIAMAIEELMEVEELDVSAEIRELEDIGITRL